MICEKYIAIIERPFSCGFIAVLIFLFLNKQIHFMKYYNNTSAIELRATIFFYYSVDLLNILIQPVLYIYIPIITYLFKIKRALISVCVYF